MADGDRCERLRALIEKRLSEPAARSAAVIAGITTLLAEGMQLYEVGQYDMAEQTLRWALRLSSG